MLSLLRPREFVTSIYDIEWQRLYQLGMRAVLTDLDNTLVEWNSPVATPKLLMWLDEVRQIGFQVCILSNNDSARVLDFAKLLGIPALYKAHKPRKRYYRKAMQVLSAAPSATIMIGDQVFTDILGGNRLGLYTILVKPIHPKEFFGTRAVRIVERMVLRNLPKPPAAVDEKSER